MARKNKCNKPAPQVYIDKEAVQKVVEGLTQLLLGVITGNDNLTTNKEIDINDKSNDSTSDST
jgi:predicted ribosome-associated RNA-binding protein Tma20